MKIKLIKDWEGLPKGSVIQNAKSIDEDYRGTWCSCDGSFIVEIPKKLCSVIEQNVDTDDSKYRYPEERNTYGWQTYDE